MSFDMDMMNKKELEQHLNDEFSYYEIEDISHLLVQEILNDASFRYMVKGF